MIQEAQRGERWHLVTLPMRAALVALQSRTTQDSRGRSERGVSGRQVLLKACCEGEATPRHALRTLILIDRVKVPRC